MVLSADAVADEIYTREAQQRSRAEQARIDVAASKARHKVEMDRLYPQWKQPG